MAPNLQHFRADIALYAFDGLRLCLRTWRHSLRTLRISVPLSHYQPTDGAAQSASINDAVSELTALQALSVSDDLVLLGTLRCCVAPIEYILYRVSAENMQELLGVLSSPDVLPTLRVFRSVHPYPELQRVRNVLVNPPSWHPCDDPYDRHMYGPIKPMKEKILNYYGDSFDGDKSTE
ncbi:hypothetical protein FISHEDRAFT_68787 [Fistulina hepatica ATCC 64428]|uniref:Uncharacterized protein n=1 Tax=Fistulina hepatica ATCC 64428 TaxID=1128425 RepID=A0A0D7ARX8_9AGAR|nr:hypothetical protein FISHEDRAFT_68787 [Fistulina hepatica ATCC 64428]